MKTLIATGVLAMLTAAACSGSDDDSKAAATDTTDTTGGTDGTEATSATDATDATGATDATIGTDPTDGTDTSEPAADITWHSHVEPIMLSICTRCHAEGGIRASTPLDDYDTAAGLAPLMKSQVTSRIMPPWGADGDCTEYHFDESLSEAEIAAISEWADNGAPKGSPDAEVVPAQERTFAVLTREDVEIQMPESYTPKLFPDDYHCFIMDWPEEKDRYITGFGAKPGNVSVVHHIIAYLAPPSMKDTIDEWDALEEGNGYTCYGGPTPSAADAGNTNLNLRFLGGWAPGGVGSDFPPGTGMKVPAGSKVILQLHYNTFGGEPQPDQTSVVFKVDDAVEKEAFIMPWANFAWLQGDSMKIPAGESDAVHSWAGSPFIFPGLADVTSLTLHSANLHMHTLGSNGTVWIERADGTNECMLDMPQYDFNWQRSFGFVTPKVINKGDKIGLECHWDNSPKNQPMIDGEQLPPKDVTWGEGTQDEMCVAFFYVVPE